MDIPIGDKHFGELVLFLGKTGGNGDVIEYAKPHTTPGCGVMAGRTDYAEGVSHLPFQHSIHRSEYAACRIESRFQRIFADGRIPGAKHICTTGDVSFDGGEVFSRMAGEYFLFCGAARLEVLKPIFEVSI
jgi:hypothetical protein